MKHIIKYLLLVFALMLVVSCGGEKSRPTFLTIGTGGVTGVYYPTGGAIAKIINNKSDQHNLRATAEATGGSVFNTNAVLTGDLEFGIVQSDRQFQAYYGQAEWEGKPNQDIRSVFSLHSEAVTLIASENSGIMALSDIKGKRIAIGNIGSGHRMNAIDALKAYGMTTQDIIAEDLKPAECAGMLQDGRIDAYFYTVGHPNGSIKEAIAGALKVRFIPITEVDNLIQEFPYYARDVIDITHYEGVDNSENVGTIGVKATLITNSKVADNVVYTLVKEVFENFDEFVSLHPALEHLTKEQMLEGLSAPLHPGAERYYREIGLLQ